jgi:hypothetical protein
LWRGGYNLSRSTLTVLIEWQTHPHITPFREYKGVNPDHVAIHDYQGHHYLPGFTAASVLDHVFYSHAGLPGKANSALEQRSHLRIAGLGIIHQEAIGIAQGNTIANDQSS